MGRLFGLVALATVSGAFASDGDVFAEVTAQFNAAFGEFKDTLPQLQGELEEHFKQAQASKDHPPVRRLSAACDALVNSALTSIQGNGCGSSRPAAGGNTVSFSQYCTNTCTAAMELVLKPLLNNTDCSSEEDKRGIRAKMQWCTRDTNNNNFCFAQTNYDSFTTLMGQAVAFTPGLTTTAWCASGSCFELNVAYYLDTLSNTTLQDLASAIAKNMCVTLPGESSTCWGEFVTARTNLATLEQEMKTDPATYCAANRMCQRMGLVDLWKATVPATFPLVQRINSMACLQNEQSQYCYKILTDKVAHTGTMVRYNGETFTNDQCAIKSYNLQQQCNPASCAPWCSGQYDCAADEGQCRYINCDTMNFDSTTRRACGCKYEIGQFMAAFGCCAASVVDFTVFGLRYGNIGSQGIEDLTTELVSSSESVRLGYTVTRAQVKLSSCGWNIDPRCLKGQRATTATFELALDNLDAASLCSDSNTLVLDSVIGNMSETFSWLVGGDSRDYLLDLCSGAASKLLKVYVMSGPVTSSETVKAMVESTFRSGRLQAAVTATLESANVPKVSTGTPIVVTTNSLSVAGSSVGSGLANFGISQIMATINGPITGTTTTTATATASDTTTTTTTMSEPAQSQDPQDPDSPVVTSTTNTTTATQGMVANGARGIFGPAFSVGFVALVAACFCIPH